VNAVELTADYESRTVKVRQLGKHPAFINGQPLNAGESVELRAGNSLFLLQNEFEHVLEFTEMKSSE
jgi:hypothetical protein